MARKTWLEILQRPWGRRSYGVRLPDGEARGCPVQALSSSVARWLRGSEGKPLARKGKAQIPQCVLPQSPVWRPALASCPPSPTPASLPQAPARPDAVHQRCREPLSDNK